VRGRAVGRRPLEQLAGLVTPDTILRWYREIVAKKYDGASQRQDGRPSTAASLQRLVVQFANENPSWGYTRIRGALRNPARQALPDP
jgi:putative transposase